MARHGDGDLLAGLDLARGRGLDQARDARRRGGLDEDAVARGEVALRLQDLLVADRSDASRRLVASRLGEVPRGGVADADGGGGNPAVTVVKPVAECVAGMLAGGWVARRTP
jgi:hypothetical protein